MSEEEKNAIAKLKHYASITAYWKQEEYTNSEVDRYIKITLKLLDRQKNYINKLVNEITETRLKLIEMFNESVNNIDYSKGDFIKDLEELLEENKNVNSNNK